MLFRSDINGCIKVDSIHLTDPGNPVLNIDSLINVSCYNSNNGQIFISVSNGMQPFSFVWSNGTTNEDADNLAAGTYTVTISDFAGCSATISATVTQPSQLQLQTNNNPTTCNSSNGNAFVLATGGTPPYSYLWNNGSSNDSIFGLSAGTYTITVTDKKNCSGTSTILITNIDGPQVSLSLSDSVSCFGLNDGAFNLTINGLAGPFTFVWSNGSTDEDPSGLTAGGYTVIITDTNNCVTIYADTIRQPDTLSLSFSTTLASCKDRKSTRLNSSHVSESRMPSSA